MRTTILVLAAMLLCMLLWLWIGSPNSDTPNDLRIESTEEAERQQAHEPMLVGAGRSKPENENAAKKVVDAPRSHVVKKKIEGIMVDRNDAPLDPLERGDCELLIKIIDAQTGKPYGASFGLWRIDVDGNEHWKRGDQRQHHQYVPASEVTVPSLPTGTYRIHIHDAAKAAKDPPPFQVDSTFSEITVQVDRPEAQIVRLRVFDDRRRPMHRGTAHLADRVASPMGGVVSPSWRAERTLKDGRAVFDFPPRLAGNFLRNPKPRKPAEATAGAFNVCAIRSATRYVRFRYGYIYEFDDLTPVYVDFSTHKLPEVTLVALVVPPSEIEDRVRLPKGMSLSEESCSLKMSCTAHPLPEGETAATFAQTIPIYVQLIHNKMRWGSGMYTVGQDTIEFTKRE